ncbi:unnamed protein product [Nippostrongylus brasiliensis]|uniref:DUF4773 domain-containing protein n=1 Tax=Nippostrongylus brasiliensis TaxID=27835 RepID=A0A0N4YIT5_NIPBR|nr:unnamed protein product [Nippostrongylus brasiliensis]
MIGVGTTGLLALLAISTSDGSEPSCLFDKTESDAAPAPDSSCIEFKIDRLKVPQICDAFKKRKKGVQSANSTLSDKCDNTSGVLTCSCSKCTLEELVDDDKVKGMVHTDWWTSERESAVWISVLFNEDPVSELKIGSVTLEIGLSRCNKANCVAYLPLAVVDRIK